MSDVVLDTFEDVASWLAVASGEATLAISRERGETGWVLRLDFDFHGGGGFVVARRDLALAMPEAYAIHFRVRGVAPRNRFELKLADRSGRNVWWYHDDDFDFPADWRARTIRSSEIEFAWGPAGGGALDEAGALEIAIAAKLGGAGTIWIEALTLSDETFREPIAIRASSTAPGHAAEHTVDMSSRMSWRSATAEPAWLELDFGRVREFGGLVIDWAQGRAARAFSVEGSSDGQQWTRLYGTDRGGARRSFIYLPKCAARFVRIALLLSTGDGFEVERIAVKPFDFSRSEAEFFHSLAATVEAGHYPKYWRRQQSYWTPIGPVDGGSRQALMNQEGLVEVDKGTFSLEPFLYVDGRLLSWADAIISQELRDGDLPIPSSVWKLGSIGLRIEACAVGEGVGTCLFVRYELTNGATRSQRVTLFVTARPFQVTPPWQAYRGLGGVGAIRELSLRDGTLWVNRSKAVHTLFAATGGVATFAEGGVLPALSRDEVPAASDLVDDSGWASAALRVELELGPNQGKSFDVAIPFGEGAIGAPLSVAQANDPFAVSSQQWATKLAGLRVTGASAEAVAAAARTCAAHILINRDDAMLQPGPRRYQRAWIRDGATMAAALLRIGCRDEVARFLRWYAPYQREDGMVPCCVDHDGPDWLVEHDSHGQWIYTVCEYFRFARDRALLEELWPSVVHAADHIASLRATRMSPDYRHGAKRTRFGLLPESASHEGYLAHPVHAYFDDFWALRGLDDAAQLALTLRRTAEAARFAAERESVRQSLYASIREVIADRQLRYVPGSVEWADFDANATSVAIATTDAAAELPTEQLLFTYDEYLRGFRDRRDGRIDWSNYTPYEIRNLAAFVRLGRRADAVELLEFFMEDRRPRAWNQWPEIAYRDPQSPGHLGDVPHSWIGAEFVLAVMTLFAFERMVDRSLVLCAGIPRSWLERDGEVGVAGLATYFGTLSYTLRLESDGALRLLVADPIDVPPGGIVIRPPLGGELSGVEVDGVAVEIDAPDEVRILSSPRDVRMFCRTGQG